MPKSRKRKLHKRTASGQRFRQGERAVPEGYTRKLGGRMKGEASSFEDFLLKVGAAVVEMAMKEIDDQAAQDLRRPFNAFGDQHFDEGSTVTLAIKGASPGEPEFDEMKPEPDSYHEATRETVEKILLEQIAAITVEAVDEMNYQNASLDVSAFAFGCYIQLTDSLHLLHLRLECKPPSPLEGFVMNNPTEG
jgi:hypothetical protein